MCTDGLPPTNNIHVSLMSVLSFFQTFSIFKGVRDVIKRSQEDVFPLATSHLSLNFNWTLLPVATTTSSGEDNFLNGAILWAAPKKRTSHSKKRMRMTHKWLKPKQHCGYCPNCGYPKLLHVLCGNCFKKTMEKTAEYRRTLFNNNNTN